MSLKRPPFDEGWVSIDRRAKIGKAASRDDMRPVLTRAYLDHRGDDWFLCATNSYILAELPISGQTQALPAGIVGLIPEALAALDRSRTGCFRIFDGLCEVDGDPALYPIVGEKEGKPPAFSSLFPDDKTVEKSKGVKDLGIDPQLLADVSAAIGAAANGIRIRFVSNLRSAVVEPLNGAEGRGLIMPIRPEV